MERSRGLLRRLHREKSPKPSLGKRFMVVADGSAQSEKAVILASNLAAKEKEGEVFIIFVVEVDHSKPRDADLPEEAARGEQILKDAVKIPLALNVKYIYDDLLQARDAAHAIVDEATEKNVDGIIVALRSQNEIERGLDHMASFILKNAGQSVIFFREKLSPESF